MFEGEAVMGHVFGNPYVKGKPSEEEPAKGKHGTDVTIP